MSFFLFFQNLYQNKKSRLLFLLIFVWALMVKILFFSVFQPVDNTYAQQRLAAQEFYQEYEKKLHPSEPQLAFYQSDSTEQGTKKISNTNQQLSTPSMNDPHVVPNEAHSTQNYTYRYLPRDIEKMRQAQVFSEKVEEFKRRQLSGQNQ